MFKFTALSLAAAFVIATPALAETQPAAQPTVSQTVSVSAPAPKIRTAAEADKVDRRNDYSLNAERPRAGVFNGDQTNDREYVLIWPDWVSELETPANFNK